MKELGYLQWLKELKKTKVKSDEGQSDVQSKLGWPSKASTLYQNLVYYTWLFFVEGSLACNFIVIIIWPSLLNWKRSHEVSNLLRQAIQSCLGNKSVSSTYKKQNQTTVQPQ